jgi:hypothetical protein
MEELENRIDATRQQVQALREDLNRRFDQLVEMVRKCVPPVANEESSKEADDRRRRMGVVLKQKHLIHMVFDVLQGGQCMLKKVMNMMRALQGCSIVYNPNDFCLDHTFHRLSSLADRSLNSPTLPCPENPSPSSMGIYKVTPC